MRALFAGTGRLPVILAEKLTHDGQGFLAFGLAGFRGELPKSIPYQEFRIEHLGSMLERLLDANVTSVVFAGAIRRPEIDAQEVDAATRVLVPRIVSAIAAGDDGALRVIIDLFEERGIKVVAAHEIVPELIAEAGVLTRVVPTDRHKTDAQTALGVIAEMGDADIGQACVVQKGAVLAREDSAGTATMLQRLAQRRTDKHTGGILFKAAKPTQDRRVDMPTIGLTTVAEVKRAGLDGIVIAAGDVMILERQAVIDACDSAGLFLWVREAT